MATEFKNPAIVGVRMFVQTVKRDESGAWHPVPTNELENPELQTITAIAEHVGVSPAVLTKRIKTLGIPTDIHQGRSAKALPQGEDLEALVAFYDAGNSISATGEKFGLSSVRARKAIIVGGGEIRSPGRGGLPQPSKAELHEMYLNANEQVNGTADACYDAEVVRLMSEEGMDEEEAKATAKRPSDATVSNWLEAAGIREREERKRYTKLEVPSFGDADAEVLEVWAEKVGFDLSSYDLEGDRTDFILDALDFAMADEGDEDEETE